MSSGLLALLDDIAALAKVAAASLDDAAAQAVKASGKAAGIVIDDTAVTPRYVVGFSSDRELPIIGKIALGSLKNKFLFLLPGALILSYFAPWAITPLLMGGGAFLCLEGWHKIHEMVTHDAHDDAAEAEGMMLLTAEQMEVAKVTSAIRTDLILSAEIMAISLASVADQSVLTQFIVLAIVGLGMTVLVYGVVAFIVRADDMGAALARSRAGVMRAIGRGIVKGMPGFLKTLSLIGTVAMLWVGGGILVHGLASLGLPQVEHIIHDMGEGAARAIGFLVALAVDHVGKPLWKRFRPRRKPAAHVTATGDAAADIPEWTGPR